MAIPRIRLAAACLLRHADRLLVIEAFDAATHEVFYKAIGGGIEFGETGEECLRRELREELHAEIDQICYLGTAEHIYTLDHQVGHVVLLLYTARFVDPAFYQIETLTGHEPEGRTYQARWLPLDDFRSGRAILGPTGLLALLEQSEREGYCSHLLSIRE